MKGLLRTVALVSVITLLLMMSTACSAKVDVLTLDVAFVPDYMEAVYYTKIMEDDEVISEYDNHYIIEKKTIDGMARIVLTTSAEAPTEDKKGVQKLNTTSTLLGEATENASEIMPLEVIQTYENTAEAKAYTYIKAVHDQEAKINNLLISQYKSDSDTEITDKNYKVKLQDQYYDEDSLFLAVGAMPLKEGFTANIMLSASNRDRLQSMKIEVLEDEDITVAAGTFTCYSVSVRPNTIFTNYATYMYFAKDNNNLLIKIQQSNTSIELKSYTTEKPATE